MTVLEAYAFFIAPLLVLALGLLVYFVARAKPDRTPAE